MTDLQHRKIDQSEMLKADCINIAKQSWLINQHPPFVVGFKNHEKFMLLMPRFISNRDMISQFIDTVSSEEEWNAMSIFNHTEEGNVEVTLVLPGRLLVATAEIIHDFGGLSLGDFSNWQDADDESVSLSHCLSRDVGNAIQKRMKKYG